MADVRAYDEFIDFIGARPSPEQIAEFRPSEATRQRLKDLITRGKDGVLAAAEISELEHCLQLEHIVRLVKVRVRRLKTTGL